MVTSSTDWQRLPLLLYGDSYRFPDIYHATRFLTPDAFITLEHDGDRIIVIKTLEQQRAATEAAATAVHGFDEFGARELMSAGLPSDEVAAAMIERLLTQRRITRVAVPSFFPIGVGDHLRARDVDLVPAPGLSERRRRKTPEEVSAIEIVENAAEQAFAAGAEAMRASTTGPEGVLVLDGRPFTAERLRAIVEGALCARGCRVDITITAPGKQAANPHAVGSGPIRAGEAVVFDIAPQHAMSRYFADIARTVSRGEPSPEIQRMYEVVRRAQDAAIAALRPGVTGKSVHELVEDVIFDAGYDTLRPGHKHRSDDSVPRGFIHGTGHGVGLEVHESPVLSPAGVDPLQSGDIITVEPGIYEPGIGGVRIEDMLLITETSARNLTHAPRDLVV